MSGSWFWKRFEALELSMQKVDVMAGGGRWGVEVAPGSVCVDDVLVPYLEVFPHALRARVWDEFGDEPSYGGFRQAVETYLGGRLDDVTVRYTGGDVYLVKGVGLRELPGSVADVPDSAVLRTPIIWGNVDGSCLEGFGYLDDFSAMVRALVASVRLGGAVADSKPECGMLGVVATGEAVQGCGPAESATGVAVTSAVASVALESAGELCASLGSCYAEYGPCASCRVACPEGVFGRSFGCGGRPLVREADGIGDYVETRTDYLAGIGWAEGRVDAVWLDASGGCLADPGVVGDELRSVTVSDSWRPVASPTCSECTGPSPLDVGDVRPVFVQAQSVCVLGPPVLVTPPGRWSFFLEPGDTARFAGGELLANGAGMVVAGEAMMRFEVQLRRGYVVARAFDDTGWTRLMHEGFRWSLVTLSQYVKTSVLPRVCVQMSAAQTPFGERAQLECGIERIAVADLGLPWAVASPVFQPMDRVGGGCVRVGEFGTVVCTGVARVLMASCVALGPGLVAVVNYCRRGEESAFGGVFQFVVCEVSGLGKPAFIPVDCQLDDNLSDDDPGLESAD